MSESKIRIGTEIRKAREAAGMVGVGQEYISEIELGKHVPGVVLLTKLAGALNVKFAIGPEMVWTQTSRLTP